MTAFPTSETGASGVPAGSGVEQLDAVYEIVSLLATRPEAPMVLRRAAALAASVTTFPLALVLVGETAIDSVYVSGDADAATVAALAGTDPGSPFATAVESSRESMDGAQPYWWATPLRVADRRHGVLVLGAPRRPSQPPDERFLETLARLLARSAAELNVPAGETYPSAGPAVEAVIEGLSDAVALVDTDGRLRTANAAYRRLLADSGAGDGPLAAHADLIELRDRQGRAVKPEERALQRAVAGHTTRGERILRMADGHDRVFALNASPVFDAQAGLAGVAIVLHEMTEQLARERALRLMEDLRRGLSLSGDLRHAARVVCRRAVSLLAWVDMATVFGLDGDELRVLAHAGLPSRATRLLGAVTFGAAHRTTQSLRERRPVLFDAVTDEPGSEASRRFVVASGATTFVNLPLVAGTSPFGLIVLASRERHTPSRDELALLDALAAQVGAELEGVRRREEAETERERLQAVVDQLPEGVLLFDAGGRLGMSNHSAEEILGQRVDVNTPVLGLAARYGLLQADGRPYLSGTDPLATVFSAGRAVLGIEHLVRRADGRDLPVVSNVAPIRDSTGQLAAVIMVFQDISTLREMDRLKDEFISIAGHELRTPIASIRGLAQLLQRRPDRLDQATVSAALLAISEQADQMSALVDELLDMSRIRAGRLSLEFAELDLGALILQPVERARLQREPVTFSVEGELTVSGDRTRLSQVFNNLLDNAVKYSDPGSSVEVRAARAGAYAVVTVADHGIGIAGEDLERVFERFFRAENATLQAGGLGLGLYLCREIVERHGGQIALESELGRGTTFTVTLPLVVGATGVE